MCGGDNSRPNDICFFDLSFDPDEILDLDFTEINKMVQAGGRDLPLKKYKINKTIPICSHKLLTSNNHFDISHDELQRRADIVKLNKDFFTKVSQALEDRIMNFPEPDHLEGKIFRVGHLGYINDRDIITVISAISNVLIDLGKITAKEAGESLVVASKYLEAN